MNRVVHQINEAFLNITQTFDKVWHTGVPYKLRLSLPLNYYIILKSYPQNRYFLIKIKNEYSELFSIHAGIPQGSVPDNYYNYYSLLTSNFIRTYISNLHRYCSLGQSPSKYKTDL
jgi:hypothetical protein